MVATNGPANFLVLTEGGLDVCMDTKDLYMYQFSGYVSSFCAHNLASIGGGNVCQNIGASRFGRAIMGAIQTTPKPFFVPDATVVLVVCPLHAK
jgi:hypothetical protein